MKDVASLWVNHQIAAKLGGFETTTIKFPHLRYLTLETPLQLVLHRWKSLDWDYLRKKGRAEGALWWRAVDLMRDDLERLYRAVGLKDARTKAEDDVHALLAAEEVTGPWRKAVEAGKARGRKSVARWLIGRRMGLDFYGRAFGPKSTERFFLALPEARSNLAKAGPKDGVLLRFFLSSLGVPRARVPLAAAFLASQLGAGPPAFQTRRTRQRKGVEAKLDDGLRRLALSTAAARLSFRVPIEATDLSALVPDERVRAEKLVRQAFPHSSAKDIAELFDSFDVAWKNWDERPGLVKVEGMNQPRVHDVSRRRKKR